jgi:hypothetical protein
MDPETQRELLTIGGFLYIVGIGVAIIYGLYWAFGLLSLILNGARLAKAAARWLEANCPIPPTPPAPKPWKYRWWL